MNEMRRNPHKRFTCPVCKKEKLGYEFTEYPDVSKCGACFVHPFKCRNCGRINKVSEERDMRDQIPFCRYCFSTELEKVEN